MQNTHVRINKEEIMVERSGEERETLQYSPEFRKQEYLDRITSAQEIKTQIKDIERS